MNTHFQHTFMFKQLVKWILHLMTPLKQSLEKFKWNKKKGHLGQNTTDFIGPYIYIYIYIYNGLQKSCHISSAINTRMVLWINGNISSPIFHTGDLSPYLLVLWLCVLLKVPFANIQFLKNRQTILMTLDFCLIKHCLISPAMITNS